MVYGPVGKHKQKQTPIFHVCVYLISAAIYVLHHTVRPKPYPVINHTKPHRPTAGRAQCRAVVRVRVLPTEDREGSAAAELLRNSEDHLSSFVEIYVRIR